MSIDTDERMGFIARAPFTTQNIASLGTFTFTATDAGWTEALVSGIYSAAGLQTVRVGVGSDLIYVFCERTFNFVIKLNPLTIPAIQVDNRGANNCFTNVTLMRNKFVESLLVT